MDGSGGDRQAMAGTETAFEPPHVTRLPEVVSFPTFFRREHPGLVALAWGLTGSRETAEDVAQEAMLALHKRWDDLALIDNPTAYVRRTCANLAVSWVRRRARESKAVARLAGMRPTESPVDEDTDAFWAAVRRLPRRQAQVVALYYGYDLGIDEVAEILQLAPGSVKSHLHRARSSMEPSLSAGRGRPEEAI
jgi:RNA polymerase sigma factor (sigma-70 family)